ncbi:secE/sec61 [Calocera viscosa TUFC12733]|uniref:SecE/sec61 n=1 Tax=Calocera viscosa (strain TUFC12733) TaxID=1330018 RepID=A0A167LT26_CALVF|nr:secE/sec61 [Calocera viscosa TUFC12733]
MSERFKEFIEVPQQFFREGNQFLNRCTKPDKKEYIQISRAVAIGFVVMGLLGYFVKLIHIPMCVLLLPFSGAC